MFENNGFNFTLENCGICIPNATKLINRALLIKPMVCLLSKNLWKHVIWASLYGILPENK
jgi:hypothetical protein